MGRQHYVSFSTHGNAYGLCGTAVPVFLTHESPKLCPTDPGQARSPQGQGGNSVDRYSQHPEYQISLGTL